MEKIGYVTLEEAKAQLKKRVVIDDELLNKLPKALQRAFDKIEILKIRNAGTPNKFPRKQESEVPERVKLAQILEAYAITVSEEEDLVQKIKSQSSKNLSITYNEKEKDTLFASKYAFNNIKGYIRKSYGWS